MATVRELLTTWGFDVDFATLDRMDAKVGRLTKEVGGIGANLDKVAKSMVSFGTRMSLFVTAPIVAASIGLFKLAADAEETESKFNTVFSGISKSSKDVAKNLGRDFGLGSDKARELLGNTGDLLTGFGFTQKSALDLSKQVNELAVDLVSFTNFSGGAEGASAALTKALLGERESVKSLGISILDEDVKKRVAINTAKGLTFETVRQAKAFATLQIAQDQSKNAIGDWARTSGSASNQARQLFTDLRDMGIEIGKILIPTFESLIATARDAIFWFSQLDEGTKENIVLFFALIAVVGPLILILGLLGVSIIAAIRAWTLMKVAIIGARTAMLAFTAASLILPAILLALGLGVGVLIDDFRRFFNGQDSALGEWLGEWKVVQKGLEGVWGDIIDGASATFQFIDDLINSPLETLQRLIEELKFLPGFLSETLGFGDSEIGVNSQVAAQGVLAGTGRINRNSNVSVNANIAMSIPEGTPQQQADFVRDAGKQAVQDEIELILRRANNEFPDVE